MSGYDQVAVRVGVFCRPDGFNAISLGWPFGRFTFGAVGCSLSAPGYAAASVGRTFAWSEVVSAERTRWGVRFRFADRSQSVVVGTLVPSARLRLVEAARTYCPAGTFDDTVHRLLPWLRDPEDLISNAS